MPGARLPCAPRLTRGSYGGESSVGPQTRPEALAAPWTPPTRSEGIFNHPRERGAVIVSRFSVAAGRDCLWPDMRIRIHSEIIEPYCGIIGELTLDWEMEGRDRGRIEGIYP